MVAQMITRDCILAIQVCYIRNYTLVIWTSLSTTVLRDCTLVIRILNVRSLSPLTKAGPKILSAVARCP